VDDPVNVCAAAENVPAPWLWLLPAALVTADPVKAWAPTVVLDPVKVSAGTVVLDPVNVSAGTVRFGAVALQALAVLVPWAILVAAQLPVVAVAAFDPSGVMVTEAFDPSGVIVTLALVPAATTL